MEAYETTQPKKGLKQPPHTQDKTPTESRSLSAGPSLALVLEGEQGPSSIWLGLSKKGPLNPFDLMVEPKISALFARAIQKGITETKPILMVDSMEAGPRYIVLTAQPGSSREEQALWISELSSMLKPLFSTQNAAGCTPQLGFYLAPELLGDASALSLSSELLERLISDSLCQHFQLLVGEHALNPLLSMGLALKALLKQKGHSLYLYH